MLLSKSDFQTGHRCVKRLWHEKHGIWHADLSANDKKNAFEGNRFNEAVHQHFPDGIMIGWGHGSAERAARKTAEYLARDSVTLFEAFFLHDGLLCLADVINKQGDEITLIEAKSSSNPRVTQKDDFEHIYDAAFQAYIMSRCGYPPNKILLLHANNECVWPYQENLFSFVDITDESFARFSEVEIVSTRLLGSLNQNSQPDTAIGKFCKKPVDKACPHIQACWALPTGATIYDLPRLSDARVEMLEAESIHLIQDIPPTADLSDTQWDIVNLIQNEARSVDTDSVKELLDQLEYPLHFFDFETYNPAVPMWSKSRPWQQVPFQYSLHVLHDDGVLEHHEYLHTDTSDPRSELIQAMQEHFLEHGSIVVYYAPFEKTRIAEMAEDFPEYANFLLSLNDRIWDQYDVFKHGFNDYRLALSKSIKVVLPTFVPDLSYKTLNVQRGDEAQLEWRKLIDLKPGTIKDQIVGDLKAYCELDTLAMVRLHACLQGLLEE